MEQNEQRTKVMENDTNSNYSSWREALEYISLMTKKMYSERKPKDRQFYKELDRFIEQEMKKATDMFGPLDDIFKVYKAEKKVD